MKVTCSFDGLPPADGSYVFFRRITFVPLAFLEADRSYVGRHKEAVLLWCLSDTPIQGVHLSYE
jgi:hypothetical protein